MFDMLGNVLKNLCSKPATRDYPAKPREIYENTRGQVGDVEIDKCIFCGICQRKCPSNAIKVDRNEKSWSVDRFKCIVCGYCQEVCPKDCLKMEEKYAASAYKKDVSTLVKSED